jgi:peptidoglycan hydrolase CwlO-like protein
MTDNNYTDVLLENIQDQNKAVLEAVADIRQKVEPISSMQEDISVLKHDMQAVKAAVTETNQDLGDLKQRVEHLESAIKI